MAIGTVPGRVVPVGATVAAVLAGSLIAAQSQLNGALGQDIASPVFAGLFSSTTGLAVLLVICVLGGLDVRRVFVWPASLRAWHFVGGAAGAAAVTTAAFATPLVGVTVVGVSLVTGQSAGSLVVDHFGLSPNGVRPVSASRVAAAVLAVAGLALSSAGVGNMSVVVVLVLIAAAGAGMSVGFAANGHLQLIYGDPWLTALVNFAVSAVVIVGAIAIGFQTRVLGMPGDPRGIPIWEFGGGTLGMIWVVASSLLVTRLGVLTLALAAVAGQLTGAVLIDALVRFGEAPPTPTRLAGVALVAVAVVLASRRAGPATRRRPDAATTGSGGAHVDEGS
jgi:transporter family-2 protein